MGVATWGQLDLVGEVSELVLDSYAGYGSTCVDCAYLPSPLGQVVWRGASFEDAASYLAPPNRGGSVLPSTGYADIGFRCARSP
jgi:formylglycine-generating enzyme required for sulfatase activity